MKILETPWEKRNLGVTSVEFYFEQGDEKCIREDILNNTAYEYQVAHVPVNRIDLLYQLYEAGFKFIETKVGIAAVPEECKLPDIFARRIKGLSYYKVTTQEEIDLIYQSLKKGALKTDKVALDPYFSLEKSGHRYYMWFKDEFENGRCEPYMVSDGKNKLGYFVLRKTNQAAVMETLLIALFEKYSKSGLGFSLAYFPILEAKNLGYKKIVSGVSSNNEASLKVNEAIGYKIENIHYVLIKHL